MLLSNDVSATDFGVRIFAGCASGIIGAFLAAGIIPLFEHFGRFVTDLRLIELATLDHPLLKDLSIQAPGTWNHSMVMGMMAESAADVVGANPVVARVGAYFHDIGKSKKPLYFVENQSADENRHDKLSPSMSALIIRAHVKDGLEMAKKHQLPTIIQDMIPQHHGTSVIEYFYDKALKEAKEQGVDPSEVDKSLYSYPGPKPQTKEAGLLMLADAIEAAARTLPEPTADRIQGMVQKLINKIFASGQLNECPLTLQELHRIAKSFTRVLTGIYHHRIAYAEPAEKTKDQTDSVENSTNTKKPATSSEGNKSEKPTEEDLKRLGIGD
jgi:putative nucleotidyltransferase with HDIG domain